MKFIIQAMINNCATYGTTKSVLITGTQWDTIMGWYQNSNIKVDTTQDWGTYINLTYSGNSTELPASYRYHVSTDYTDFAVGFHTVLYIQ